MKNKLLAVLLTSLLLLSSCGGNTTPSTQTSAETNAPETTVHDEHPLSFAGILENNTYTNQCLGFSVTLDGWTCATATELGDVSDALNDFVSKTDTYKDYLTKNPTAFITDLYAVYSDGTTGINIQFQTQEKALSLMSDEAIIDLIFATQKETILSAYEEMGFEVVSFEKTALSFLGKDIPAIKSEFSVSGIPYYTLQFQKYNLDGYFATVTFSCYGEDITDTLVSLCYPIGTEAPEVTIPAITIPGIVPSVDTEGLEIGSMNGTVYSNPICGISLSLDESWTPMTADMIYSGMGNVEDGKIYGVTETAAATIFTAECTETLSNINITYQKNLPGVMTNDSIIDASLLMKDELIQTYAASGMTVTSLDKTTVTFLGEERSAIQTVGDIMGIPFFIVQIPDITAKEGYTITYTIGTFYEDTTAELLPLFSSLN